MNSLATLEKRHLRYLAGVIAAAMLVSGFALLATRAHADIGSTPPVISAISTTPTNTGATVTWTTDQAGTTQVLYGLTSSYNASTTLGTATTTNHTSFIGGLTPSTLYHFEVITANASGTLATSSDMTFTTASTTATTTTTTATTTAASSTTPVVSAVIATPSQNGAVITWNTDLSSNSQVLYGTTSAYGSVSTLNSALQTSHSVTLSGLTANTLYHFQVWSMGTGLAGTSTDMTFTTLAASSTGTTTTTSLQDQIDALKARVSILEAQVASLMAGGTGGTGTTTSTGSATIDANNSFITAGSFMDLGGRNFGHEETVKVTLNGALVATAHADGGGNFSTGSFLAPSTPGTYTFVFTGQTSGITASTNITVH